MLMNRFFAQFSLITIPPENKLVPNSPISREEVVNAISNLQNGKAPGLFSSEFLEFLGRLVDPLVRMFNEIFSNNELPQTIREANISVLLKKDKYPESCASYRSLSLLNVEWKILAKILATCLVSYLKLLKKIKLVSSRDETLVTMSGDF